MFPSPLFHLVDQPIDLDRWIQNWMQDHPEQGLDLPFLVDLGCVYLNHKRIAPRKAHEVQLNAQDIIRIHPKPRRYSKNFENFQDLIVHETSDYLVIDKPFGVPVHPTLDNLHENLLSWGAQDLGYLIYITHRLDVGTEGLMVYAKTPTAQARFNRYLKENQVQKIYQAIGKRKSQDTALLSKSPWIHWMKPSYKAPKEVLDQEFPEGLRCESRPRKIEYQDDTVKVELELVTGRTHQIRAQMSALGWPIVGDKMYGSSEHFEFQDRWELRCIELRFPEISSTIIRPERIRIGKSSLSN